MLAVKATFDGKRIVLPETLANVPPGEVIVIFENPASLSPDTEEWMKMQEEAFARAWDNDEDSIYDSL
jgi:TusA-related sulfurtransferase